MTSLSHFSRDEQVFTNEMLEVGTILPSRWWIDMREFAAWLREDSTAEFPHLVQWLISKTTPFELRGTFVPRIEWIQVTYAFGQARK